MKEYIEKSIVERMLWAVIMSKDERTIEEMLEYTPTVNAIPIPKGATNGDMIKALFPNVEFVCGDYGISAFYMRMNNDVGFASLDKSWWDKPYKKEVEE